MLRTCFRSLVRQSGEALLVGSPPRSPLSIDCDDVLSMDELVVVLVVLVLLDAGILD